MILTTKIISELSHYLGSDKIRTMAYSKEENSMVERANKETMRHLRNIVFNQKIRDSWSASLPLVAWIENANTISSIGVSPAQIIFGNSITLDRGILVPHLFQEVKHEKLSSFMSKLIKLQGNIINIARSNQTIKDNNHYARSSPLRTDFEINSYVIANFENEDHRPPDKFSPFFKGPFRIVNTYQGNKNIYTVQNLLTNKLEDYHVTNLRPFIYDDQKVDPLDVAMLASNLSKIEKVIRSKGNKKDKTNMQFLVRWQGFDSKHDTWLTWPELRDNPLLHQYLISHNLSQLIPQRHR